MTKSYNDLSPQERAQYDKAKAQLDTTYRNRNRDVLHDYHKAIADNDRDFEAELLELNIGFGIGGEA